MWVKLFLWVTFNSRNFFLDFVHVEEKIDRKENYPLKASNLLFPLRAKGGGFRALNSCKENQSFVKALRCKILVEQILKISAKTIKSWLSCDGRWRKTVNLDIMLIMCNFGDFRLQNAHIKLKFVDNIEFDGTIWINLVAINMWA